MQQLVEFPIQLAPRMPATFIGLFKGDNVGKMVVRVGPDKAV
jgi:hypothetical protein